MPRERQVLTESADIHYTMNDSPVTCFELNESSSVPATTSEHYFGEQPLSFRAAMKRYWWNGTTAVTSGVVGKSVTYTGLRDTVAAPWYDESTVTNPNVMGFLMLAYLGMRGGVRKRIRFGFSAEVTLGEFPYVIATNGDPFVAPTLGISFVATPAVPNQRGSVMYVPHTNAGIEFEIPYYSNNLFQFSCAEDYIGPNGDDDMVEDWIRNFTCSCDAAIAVGTVVTVVECMAAAEDFTFFRFLGAPYYTFET
jgi:hypothetical protein